MQEKLASMNDMVNHFGVTSETVRNWIKRRNLPAKKLGGRWRFEWREVEKWEACQSRSQADDSLLECSYKDYCTERAWRSGAIEGARRLRRDDVELLNDDCLRAMSMLEDDSIDLILTDPPYNLGLFMQSRATNLKKMRSNYFGAAGWDNLDTTEWKRSMDAFFELASRKLKKKGALIVFMAVIKVETLTALAEKHGFYYKTTGTWHKLNPMPRNMSLHFINSTEAWMYFVNQARTGTFNNNGKALHDFYETAVTPKSERECGGHPTQKPVELMSHFINTLSNPGDRVLDPFMGSGSTGVAAIENNRRFVGIELDSNYFDMAAKRMNLVRQ